MEVVRADPKKTFKLEKRIGKGTYGEVWQAHYRNTGQSIAIKIIDDIAEALEEVKETRALNRLCYNHPNLPQFMGVYVNSPADDLMHPQVWIAMELCGGGTVNELSKRCAKLIPCLTSVCPDELVVRYLSCANASSSTNIQQRNELLKKLALSHCPCLNHRKARNKHRLESGVKKRMDMSNKYVTRLFILKNMSTFETEYPPGRLPPVVIQYLLYSTVSALFHLHSFGVIHRDVKGSNILLTENGEVKLVDFGISCRLKDSLAGRTTIIGTPYWMAPEVIDTEKSDGYDTRADVWSLGVTGLELWEAEPPLAGVPPMKAFSLITHGPHPLSFYPSKPPPNIDVSPDDVLIPVTDQMPAEMFDFLTKCLDKDKSRRPSSAELLQHRFLSGVPHFIPKARHHLLNLMRSVNGRGSMANRRGSEPPRCDLSPVRQAVDTSGEGSFGRSDRTVPAALNSESLSNSPSGKSTTPKNLRQRYTSTISLNICCSSTSSPTLNMSSADSTIRSKTTSRETIESNALTHITTPTAPNGRNSSSSDGRDSMSQQNTLRSTSNSAPIHRSQGAKYMSPIPTNSSAYYSGQLKRANSTIAEIEKEMISVNINDNCPFVVQEIDEEAAQGSDIDMESSGEYEKEEVSVIERVKEPTQMKERNRSSVDVPKMNLETEGCITDVNGIIVYTPSTSEYRNLFQSNRDDLKYFVKCILQRVQNEYNDQIVFIVGKPQEPTFRLSKLIYDEIPTVLTSTKELINNAFLISEKLIGRQELSIRGMEFVFSRDLRLADASMNAFLSANASTRQIFKNPLFRAFNAYVTSRSSEISPTNDLSEIVKFQLLIMSAGFSPQEIVGLYRLMIAMSAIRFMRQIQPLKSAHRGRLSSLPEELYSCIQRRILHGEVASPCSRMSYTPSDGMTIFFEGLNYALLVAQLIGVDEKDFTNLVYSKSLWGVHAHGNVISEQFWRYLNVKKSKLMYPSSSISSQNDSGFFEDYSGSRKRCIKIRRPIQPIRIRKCIFRKVIRTRKHLEIAHRAMLKHIYHPRSHSVIRPHRTVVEMLCRRLHILCVSVVFNKLNSMLHSSLNREVFINTVKVKFYNLIPSSKSLISNTLLDLLHSKFVTSQSKSYFPGDKDKLKLHNFYQQQSKLLLEHVLQSSTSGYLSCLTIQDFIDQCFPSTECEFDKFCVMHYHGKEEYTFESVLPKLSPWQDNKMNNLLRSSNIPFLRDYYIMQNVNASENFHEIIPHIVNANATVNLMSVLDDGRSISLDSQQQNITLPIPSPPLSGNLTSQRHLRAFQDSGLLNFASINNETSGTMVMKSDEFLRRFSILNYLQFDDEKSLKVLAGKRRMAKMIPSSINAWNGLKILPLIRNSFNDSVVKVMKNCRLSSDLYFVSTDWILLSISAMTHLKLALLKLSMFSRRIQRWWRRCRQQRQMLQDISNFLYFTSINSNSSSNNYITTALPPDSSKNAISPESNDISSINAADRDSPCAPVYVVANTVLSNVPMPQSYSIPSQQISPQRIPPVSQKFNNKSKRPSPSSGIAWYEPRHQRPPAFPSVAPKPERMSSFIENPAPRYLGRHQSISTPHYNEPQETNLKRSSSARAFDIQQHNNYIPDTPSNGFITPKDSRPMARSNSSNVSRENLGGVQRRIRRRVTETPVELGDRRPVSWHVDQMEAQLIAHIEKQKLLNGEGSPVLLRCRNSSAKAPVADQRRDVRRVTSELSQSHSPYRLRSDNYAAARLEASRSPPQSAKSPEAQREEFLRVQAEITRGEYRRSREFTASSTRQNNHAIRREMTPDIQQNNQSLSSHSPRSFNNSALYGSIPDFRLLYPNESNCPQAQRRFSRPNHAERMNVVDSIQPHGYPSSTIPNPPPHHPPRRRPVTTVFDGPLTPNIFPINLPSRNHSPPREPMGQPRMTFVSSSTDGKLVIPVVESKSSLPAMQISVRLPVNAYDMDNHILKAIGGGCMRNFCYD